MTDLIATQTADGGLWHAGRRPAKDNGYADTLCGRYGWVDHRFDGSPVPAVIEINRDGVDDGQVVECLACLRIARKIGAAA